MDEIIKHEEGQQKSTAFLLCFLVAGPRMFQSPRGGSFYPFLSGRMVPKKVVG